LVTIYVRKQTKKQEDNFASFVPTPTTLKKHIPGVIVCVFCSILTQDHIDAKRGRRGQFDSFSSCFLGREETLWVPLLLHALKG